MVFRNVLSKDKCKFLENYFLETEKVARLYFDTGFISQFNKEYGRFNDPQAMGSYSIYGTIAGDIILKDLKPLVEKNLNKKLYETYSYARVYKKGAILKRHTDRESCKISATMNLGGETWPIFIDNNTSKGESIILKPGDMLLYPGFNLEHWREPLKKGECTQLFLHYVDVKDKDAERYKYDSRPMLGIDEAFKINGENNNKNNYKDYTKKYKKI